ncbi:MAG: recombinase family protein [Oscillospiraceae bacterium]|nr:recombinase family protein [Oscillospiraceae bacterium]
MRADNIMLAFAYLRLSNEEAQGGESESIKNQRMLITDYCKRHGIIIVREFIDDGYSGGTFDRPAFREMMTQVEAGKVNTVLTKDLSRLGRDMAEASYYAEQYFPEHGIRYIATHDNFDSNVENIMAPFQFAMNEVYLRDGSRKIRNVLQSKREHGEYCACPPYGYRKDPDIKTRLVPDENTACVVKRIFECAAKGDSSRKIALDLIGDGIIPPLKYRVLYRDDFGDNGAARASDVWNYTTVKRILKNQVYLGHTLLGKSKKASIKSSKKVRIPEEKWSVTKDTHPALVTQDLFDKAQRNLGKGTKNYRQYDHVRKSVFSGLVYCEQCGHALCSAGTVYKGEREKYWYLACTHMRKDIANPCPGTRIRYAELVEMMITELNTLVALPEGKREELISRAIREAGYNLSQRSAVSQVEVAKARVSSIDKIIVKLYTDNAEGIIDDERLSRLVSDLVRETQGLNKLITDAEILSIDTDGITEGYNRFFSRISDYGGIEKLNGELLQTFVERIEIGPKVKNVQQVNVFYKFIGNIALSDSVSDAS